MTFREIQKIIEKDGWKLVRTEGSHHHYKHKTKKGLVTISKHGNKDLSKRDIQSIYRQAQIKK